MRQRILSAIKRVQFVIDRISYILLTGCWCDTGLNAHAPITDNIKMELTGIC